MPVLMVLYWWPLRLFSRRVKTKGPRLPKVLKVTERVRKEEKRGL